VAEKEETRQLCHEVLGLLKRNTHRIQDLVKEMADCVKGLSTPPQFASCQVATVVQQVFDTLRLVAEEKGVSFHGEGLEDLPAILADERRLYIALYNLVNNAIPEVPPGGSITVLGRREPRAAAVRLSVSDTGRGMPPEVRESLFTSRTISRKVGGTGLGTKIVKDVVEAHGGRIAVESQEGVGTTFHLRLPIHPPGWRRLPPGSRKANSRDKQKPAGL
jgi:signal transduction histidine kinase